ncbi:MAG: hypothetical protein M1814_002311 [Vezdaea aestivalis]|nr:MAG: hypothetical protein M1814_002311 [Vezdaea aestivalis]
MSQVEDMSNEPTPSYQPPVYTPARRGLSIKEKLMRKSTTSALFLNSSTKAQISLPKMIPTLKTDASAAKQSGTSDLQRHSNPIRAAQPTRIIFDSWNISTTGHQTFRNGLSGSSAWRKFRIGKNNDQFRGIGESGAKRKLEEDSTGDSANGETEQSPSKYDNVGRYGTHDHKRIKFNNSNDAIESHVQANMGKEHSKRLQAAYPSRSSSPERWKSASTLLIDRPLKSKQRILPAVQKVRTTAPSALAPQKQKRHLFEGLVFYINGSTAPLVGDHRLKQIIADHGGNMALGLARKSVTHVVLGQPNKAVGPSGAGGGLAAGKIENEVTVKHSRVKFVKVEW